MKKTLIALSTCCLIFFSSFSVAADKLTIVGQPVVVEKTGDVYVPATALETQGYYYLKFDNTNSRVCYQEVQPSLANVDAGIFAIRLGNETVQLHCYDYSPDYFVVQ